jgi:hypothetical protein
LDHNEIPEDATGGDPECYAFWMKNKCAWWVAVGKDPDEAYSRLEVRCRMEHARRKGVKEGEMYAQMVVCNVCMRVFDDTMHTIEEPIEQLAVMMLQMDKGLAHICEDCVRLIVEEHEKEER